LFDSFYGPKERPAGLALGAKDKRQQAAGKARPPADLIVGFALGAVIGAATLHILFFNWRVGLATVSGLDRTSVYSLLLGAFGFYPYCPRIPTKESTFKGQVASS
jgi:hypothetical protein